MRASVLLILSVLALASAQQTAIEVQAAFAKLNITRNPLVRIAFRPRATVEISFGSHVYDTVPTTIPSPCVSQEHLRIKISGPGLKAGTRFVVAIVDLDPPAPYTPLVRHLLATDYVLGDDGFLSNTTVSPVLFPFGPPQGTGAHRYTIILWEQRQNFVLPAKYNPFDMNQLLGFSVTQFVSDAHLGPAVAGFIFLSAYDANNGSYCKSNTALAVTSGYATFYNAGMGACGIQNNNGQLIAALNAQQFGGGNPNKNHNCNRRARVTGPRGSVTVTITDKCPGCAHGDLDLTPTAFDKIAQRSQGRVPITWSFI